MQRILLLVLIFSFSLIKVQGQAPEGNLQITHLAGDFYIYTTYSLYKGERIPANGMYLVSTEGVVLFDSPWDTTQFQPLLDSIQARHHKNVVICFATHFHNDRTAGLEYYRKLGIKTYTSALTDELSRKDGMKRAEFLIAKDTVFTVGGYSFESYYPGPGHSPDNIIFWFSKERIIYGACLIKSFEDEDLGYLGDANMKEYARTIQRVQQKCKQPRWVIVGHGNWSKVSSLDHTRKMAEALQKKSGKK